MSGLPQTDSKLLAMSRSRIAESRQMLATSWSERVKGKHVALLASSLVTIAESRQLLAAVEHSRSIRRDGEPPSDAATMLPAAGVAPQPAEAPAEAETNAALSVRVFQDGTRFCWTVRDPGNQILGRGTAQTDLKARVDAFRAGMIYLDCADGRLEADNTILH